MAERREWLILAGAEQDHSSLTITAVNVSIIGQYTLEADGVFIELISPFTKLIRSRFLTRKIYRVVFRRVLGDRS